MASKFSRAKPIGSILAWHPAQDGLARCTCIASFIDSGFPARSVLSDGTSGGGGGGGEASRFSSTYFPRNTGDVRVLYDVIDRMLPWPSRPRRGLPSGSVTRRKWLPVMFGIA